MHQDAKINRLKSQIANLKRALKELPRLERELAESKKKQRELIARRAAWDKKHNTPEAIARWRRG